MREKGDGKKVEVSKELKDLRRTRGGQRAFAIQVLKSSETILKESEGDIVTGANRIELINNATILKEKLNELPKLD